MASISPDLNSLLSQMMDPSQLDGTNGRLGSIGVHQVFYHLRGEIERVGLDLVSYLPDGKIRNIGLDDVMYRSASRIATVGEQYVVYNEENGHIARIGTQSVSYIDSSRKENDES